MGEASGLRWVWTCVRVRLSKKGQGEEWSQASAQFWGSFLCRPMGNTEPGSPLWRYPHLTGMGSTFISSHGGSLAGTSMVRGTGWVQSTAVGCQLPSCALGRETPGDDGRAVTTVSWLQWVPDL